VARIGRRTFLLGLAAAAAAATAGAGFLAFRVRGYTGIVIERLFEELDARRYPHLGYTDALLAHFDYLDLERADVERFTEVYTRLFGGKRWSTKLTLAYDTFLKSTDFFPNGADESRPVRFVAIYAPRANPCYNPFAPS